MPSPRTLDDVIAGLPVRIRQDHLAPPPYTGHRASPCVGLAVESMRRHMTDEGWQIFAGLQGAGYQLAGHALTTVGADGKRYQDLTQVSGILAIVDPGLVVVQDKREWEGLTADRSRDPRMRFDGIELLGHREDIFKATVLKDCHHDYLYNRRAASDMGCHVWIIYYHPRIVKALCPFVREKDIVRTYHSIDRKLVPPYADRQGGTLLSGAISRGVYPLRQRLLGGQGYYGVEVLRHPGYHRRGCETPQYLATLAGYKVAICTSSIYGYALRKIVEATACGCVVITDLPSDDILPGIDENLVRVHPEIPDGELREAIRSAEVGYNPVRQEYLASVAKMVYDFRAVGTKLAEDLEEMRCSYD